MSSLQVKDFPEELYSSLRDCAAAEDRSISQQTVHVLREYLKRYEQSGGNDAGVFEDERVVAPAFFQIEIRNAFWEYVHVHATDVKTAESSVRIALGYVDEFIPSEANAAESFREAIRCDHSVYDMLYLTLARRHAGTLLTCDRKLQGLCDELGVDYVHHAEP